MNGPYPFEPLPPFAFDVIPLELGTPPPVCRVCNDAGIIWSADPDGESLYESACPEPVHDDERLERLRGLLREWRARG